MHLATNYDLYKLVYVCVIVISEADVSKRSLLHRMYVAHLVLILALVVSHVDRAARLLKLGVSGKVLVHLAVRVLLFQNINCRYRLPVGHVLVIALCLVVRVAEDTLAILNDLGALWLRESHIEHVLICLDQAGVAAELVIHLVLRVAEHITLVSSRCSVRLASVRLRSLVVLAQVGVEGPLAMSWSVVRAETTGRVANVGIAAASIVDVNNGLGVNVGQVVDRALLQELERTYRESRIRMERPLRNLSFI